MPTQALTPERTVERFRAMGRPRFYHANRAGLSRAAHVEPQSPKPRLECPYCGHLAPSRQGLAQHEAQCQFR